MTSLTDYLFHYNEHTDLWNAFTREDSTTYFNDIKKCKSLLASEHLKVLVDYIATEKHNYDRATDTNKKNKRT